MRLFQKWRADDGERTGGCNDDRYGSGGSVAHRRGGYDGKSSRLLGSNAFRGWRSQCPGCRTHSWGARRGGLDHLVCDVAQLAQGGGYSTLRPAYAWLSASSRPRLCCAYRPSRTHRRQMRNSPPVAREMASLLSGWPG